jgi:hypothetical protein
MKKRLGLLLFWLCCLPLWAVAQSPVTGFCEKGGQSVVTNGVSSTTKVQRTYVGCTVSVFDAGSTNLSTIFSDGIGTPKANPFTADATTGYWAFYANNGSYDVSITASGLSATTIRTVKIADASSSPLSGSGTSGRVPKWSGTSSITNSQITDNAVSIGINNTSPAASALLDLTSTTQGLLPPRLTTTQRDAIASPANGLFIYNSTTGQFNGFQAGAWGAIGGGAGSGITSLNGLTGASQTFSSSNDVNVTMGINSVGTVHTFTMGWSGTLAKTRTLGTTVYTDQGNTFSAGAQDFSAASTFTIPVAGGSTPTVSGRLAYDSTSNTFEYGANGTNRTVANLSESQTFSNKTLVAPNIGDFTGAQHSHQNAAGGGSLDVAAIGSGVFSLARGGTNTTSASYSTNGAFYYDGSKFITTAAGGAGTLCLQATDGGVPTFGACSGTAATALSALTAATTSNTLNSGDNAQIWKWTLTTSGKTGWRISENTAGTAAGTPILFAIDTLAASTVNPFQVTALGTANGIRVDTTGKLAKIGTGSVTADALNGLSTNGWLVQSSTGVFTARTFSAGTGISITNTDGTGGNPAFTIDPAASITWTGTETFSLFRDKGSQVFDVRAYGAVCDGSTDDSTAIAAAITAAVVAGGGIVQFPQSTSQCAIASTINVGNGTSTTISTYHGITLRGVGGLRLSATSTGQPTQIIWTGSTSTSNVMIKVNGPIGAIRIEHLLLNCNDKAGIGLQVIHAEGTIIRDVDLYAYTAIGLDVDAYNTTNFSGQTVNNYGNTGYVEDLFENSSNNNVIGIRMGKTGPVSQWVFNGGRLRMDGTTGSAAVELRFADHNSFYNTVGAAAQGIRAKPISGQASYPQNNFFYGGSWTGTTGTDATAVDNTDATWAPGNFGIFFSPFQTADGATQPTTTGFWGVTDTRHWFAPSYTFDSTTITQKSTAASSFAPELYLVNSNTSSDVSLKLYHGNTQGWRVRLGGSTANTLFFDATTDDSTFVTKLSVDSSGSLIQTGVTFANLPGAPVNGTFIYCSNCTITSPCASGGTGALAKRLNSSWVCN